MQRKTKIILIVCLCIAVCCLVGFSLWFTICQKSYDNSMVYAPGSTYRVGARTYQIPNLPINNGNKVNILKEDFLLQLRNLFIKVNDLFRAEQIAIWPSGGTLLGFVRHKTFIPWDDDIDVHTDVKHKEYLFSPEFSQKAWDIAQLEVIFLMGFNANTATKEGAAVRLRFPNTSTPVCDVFFTTPYQGHIYKIDSWTNSTNYHLSTKEIWNPEWLYPLQENTLIDDMTCTMPNDPHSMLQQQYGPNVLKSMYSRTQLISHQTPFELLSFVWTTHPINKKQHNAPKSH
jgi:hypothetical protein